MAHLASGEARCVQGALQADGWKLVVGPELQNSWFGWFSPNVTGNVTDWEVSEVRPRTPRSRKMRPFMPESLYFIRSLHKCGSSWVLLSFKHRNTAFCVFVGRHKRKKNRKGSLEPRPCACVCVSS